MDTLAIVVAIVSVGSIIINVLMLRACQKMYTEYFKDKSMDGRTK
jgi:hypothetical protein